MTQDNRPARYVERFNEGPDDEPIEQVVYRASSLGVCDVHILATAQGMIGADKPEWFQQVLDEGSLAEGVIACMWEEETGVWTANSQQEVELEIGEIDGRRVIIRGHIDGMRDGLGPIVLREYKKFRKSTWENFLRQGIEVNKNYPWQASVYMHALGAEECEFVGGHLIGYYDSKEEGDPHRTIYDSLDDVPAGVIPLPEISEVKHKPILAPPIALKDIRARIVRWERLINAGTPLSEGKCEKPYAYPCPFYTLHPDDDEPEVFAIAPGPKNEVIGGAIKRLHGTTRRLTELNAEIRRLDAERKADTVILREELGKLGQDANDATVIQYGSLSLTRTRSHVDEAVITRKAYDKDSFTATKTPDLSAKPAPRKAAKKAAGKTEKTTRVGGKK